ncbi:MAG TPA: hypothetical protein VGD14_07840 [bacterium]
MQCPNGCSVPMEQIKEDRIYYRNGEPLVITDLMIHVCPNCGQESMPLTFARLVEDVLNGKVKSAGKFVAEKYETNDIYV